MLDEQPSMHDGLSAASHLVEELNASLCIDVERRGQ